jgi:MFS family permease
MLMPVPPNRPWYRELDSYHWLVLVVCTLSWSFDCLTQQIFNLTRKPAMADLLATSPGDPNVAFFGAWSTAALLIGWATGGIVFGILGDRIGRVKTLIIMILSYSLSTGLCGLSQGQYDYILYCFITGMGAGGIFPVGCTLVAESLPDKTRAHALGMLQAFSAFGNVGAGFIWMGMIALWSQGAIDHPWRWFFSAGILPASLSIIIIRRLHEPEAWTKAVATGKLTKKAGSLAELFGDPRWRPRAIVGMLLAASGVIGLWGIGVFSNDLTQSFIGRQYDDAQRAEGQAKKDSQFVAGLIAAPEKIQAVYTTPEGKPGIRTRDLLGTEDKDLDAKALYEGAASLMLKGQPVSAASVLNLLDQADKDRKVQPAAQTAEDKVRRAELLKDPAPAASFTDHVTRIQVRQKARGIEALHWAAVTLVMFNAGAFFGMYAFARITNRIGRRPTFALFFVAAGLTTAFAFLYMSQKSHLFWMVPLMGASQLSLFGGYAIYFPELFPTRLRSTGTSFCYNVGRYVAAIGPLGTGLLTSYVFYNPGNPVQATRYAGVAMCSCFLVGLVALLFAPETRGQPLPE